eukprot:TRINITY_DN28301_c0_g1_i1.p1 TRINITY_DN28301_c0_g1~~TRINITY_DN28301_c0_g1_i1.p1  ORF type:complete len:594 (+),score=97.96 TRINITY_DN28301_c0_g1_i1:150-1784(+)
MESTLDVPEGWSISGPALPHASIEITFAVKQQNLQKLHDELMRVSDPDSPSYGDHLTNEEVNALTAPRREHHAAVMDFLSAHGLAGKNATPNGDQIVVVVSAALAETLLSAKYMQFHHRETGATVDRTVSGYALPATVAEAVDFVAPTTHIPAIRRPARHAGNHSNGFSVNTPATLRQLYNIGTQGGKAAGNKQAVTAFLEQFYSEQALKDFWTKYCTDFACGKGLPKLVGDATSGDPPGTESMLDIEYLTGVGGNIESEFWGFSGRDSGNPQNEPFLKWLQAVSSTGDADIPKVFSTSYGEPESFWSPAAAARLSAEFQKAGARGITLLFASGDSGANCKGGKFAANMPAASPYVTSVGGTQPGNGFPKPGTETAVGLSSGGFSNYWPTPAWQQDAVNSYFKQPGLPDESTRGYNTSGRGFPDIAAQASTYCVVPFGCMVSGTSCASPTAAGVFGLLNDLRLQGGKSTLGFLNPLLYKNAGAFNDITTGSSDGCGLFSKGWPAKAGWDAVTGLGTPDFEKLAKVVMELPGPAPKWQRGETLVV